jgi:two-component system sensor kinase FixL
VIAVAIGSRRPFWSRALGGSAAARDLIWRLRRPFGLRLHLMLLVVIAVLPSLLIGTFIMSIVSHEFVRSQQRGLARDAAALGAVLDHQLRRLAGQAEAALVADDAAPAEPASPDSRQPRGARQRPRLAAILGAANAEAAIWRPGREGLVAESAFGGGGVDLAPAETARLKAIASRLSGTAELAVTLIGEAGLDQAGRRRRPALGVLLGVPPRAGLPADLAGSVLQIVLPPAASDDMLSLGGARPNLSSRVFAPGGAVAARSDAVDNAGPTERFLTALPPVADENASFQAVGQMRAGGRTYLLARAALPHASGWSVLLVKQAASQALDWLIPLSELVRFASLLLALAAAAWLSKRLTRPLARLTADASFVASSGELASGSEPVSSVSEFNELRAILMRSTAVLRRRAAAERMALNEARTGHELLASVVTATEDLIYVKDTELRLLLANRATLCMSGIDREEWQVLGRSIDELLPPEAARREEALDRRVLAGGERNAMRLDWPDRDGAMHSFMLTKSLWLDASGRIIGVVTVAHDATEQRAAEARLAAMQADLLRVSRLSAMGAMASGLAHELNQPLAAATNFLNAAGRLLAGTAAVPAGSSASRLARLAVADAADQMLRAGEIVRRLRSFIGRGEAALVPEDIGDVIEETCELSRADGAAGGAELVVREAGAGEMALLDRTQFQQVLLNLIRNAAEALGSAPDGRIEIACARLADGTARVSVADNGPGLDPEVSGRLFEPFVSTKRDGMGIGLTICRTIVEGHGGRMAAEPREGGGTIFHVVLPGVRDSREQEALDAA